MLFPISEIRANLSGLTTEVTDIRRALVSGKHLTPLHQIITKNIGKSSLMDGNDT